MQTARETRLSLTGNSKNLSKLIFQFNENKILAKNEIEDIFKSKLQGDIKFRDVEQLLEVCT